ncbi:MAG: DinB family protein [Thermodesulfobacteriota bacterium]
MRQVVHHLPDSHLNAYVRFKLALTEEQPLIRTYEESLWAELPEAKSAPVEISLSLLDAIHARWLSAIRSLPAASLERRFRPPVWSRQS